MSSSRNNNNNKKRNSYYSSLPSLDSYLLPETFKQEPIPELEWNTSPLDLPHPIEVKSIEQLINPSCVKKEGEEEEVEWEEETNRTHENQTYVMPSLFPEFHKLLQLKGCEYGYFEYLTFNSLPQHKLTNKVIAVQIQNPNRSVMSCRSASLESELLGPSGTWFIAKYNRWMTFPSCRSGEACLGNHTYGIGGGILEQPRILRSSMDEKDYQYLINNGKFSQDWKPQFCVLCNRYVTLKTVFYHRFACFQNDQNGFLFKPSQQESSFEQIQTKGIQDYFNLRDTVNGYASTHMIDIIERDCILYPIVMYQPQYLSCYRHPHDYRINEKTNEKVYDAWMIDQRQILYNENIELIPTIGESTQNF